MLDSLTDQSVFRVDAGVNYSEYPTFAGFDCHDTSPGGVEVDPDIAAKAAAMLREREQKAA